jgi:hypothetical protein
VTDSETGEVSYLSSPEMMKDQGGGMIFIFDDVPRASETPGLPVV